MLGRSFILINLFIVAVANAQTPAPTPPIKPFMPAAGYCLPASVGFLESETKAFEGMRKCSRGDTIVVPTRSASAVARICDFSKAIVTAGENIVCVIVMPERASR